MTQRTGNWGVPAYDAAGNMTTMPHPGSPTSSAACTYDLPAGRQVPGTGW